MRSGIVWTLAICLLTTGLDAAQLAPASQDDSEGAGSIIEVVRAFGEEVTPSGDIQRAKAVAPAEKAESSRREGPAPERADDKSRNETKLSDPERIARLQRAIEGDQKNLAELKGVLSAPDGEYKKSEAEFEQLDRSLEEKKKDVERFRAEDEQEQAATIESEIAELEKRWSLAKERFQLAIEERRALIEKIKALEEKIDQDSAALARLTGDVQTRPAIESTPLTQPEHAHPAAPEQVPPTPLNQSVSAAQRNPVAPEPPVPGELQGIPGSPSTANAGKIPTPVIASARSKTPSHRVDEELMRAAEEARRSATAAEEAEDAARSVSARIAVLNRAIRLERTLLETARKKFDNAHETLQEVQEEFLKKSLEGADPAELNVLRTEIKETDKRLREARLDSVEQGVYLDQLQSELATLQAEQIDAMREAESRRLEAERARKVVEQLQNPFSPQNAMRWLAKHGPVILGICLAVICFVWLSRICEGRFTDLMARGNSRGTQEERENRAKTLVGVFHNAANVVIVAGGIVMVLDDVGIPVAPLIGGAAVFGLAVAFGAQSLIKDYFSGFMILLEQQYLVNDVVKIGDISGQVERISLRMTVLRDLEGRVHFIPHGQINTLTNLTHGWSRAVFEIGVAYKEDVDRVMALLLELGMRLRQDPEFRLLILEDPVMLGIDRFGESSVTIKFYIKTRPLKQWAVKREMLRRIKQRFDEVGIEIPYPHRTIYQHHIEAPKELDREPTGPRWSNEAAA